MIELLEKVGHTLNGREDFIARTNGCVRASDSLNEFEESWGKIQEEFHLTDNKWLHQIYKIQYLWVHVTGFHTQHAKRNSASIYD